MDEKQINELLECSVCLERLDQTCKALPCQHTFCRRCLDEILLTHHELRCPECRALVTTRVSDLPTNIIVVRILEGLKTKGHLAGSSSGRLSRHAGGSPSRVGRSSPHKHDGSRHGSQPCAKALYNYDSAEKDDLVFKKGDMINLWRQVDDNWFHGELNGKSGFFPANFVQVLVPLHQIPQCRTLYDFDLKDENEKDCLSFKKDEVLTVIRKVDENWLEGRKGDKIGIFPVTFVDLNESARSLINAKSNMTILPTQTSSSTVTSSTVTTSTLVSTSTAVASGDVTTATSTSVCTTSSSRPAAVIEPTSLGSTSSSNTMSTSGVPSSTATAVSETQPGAASVQTSTASTSAITADTSSLTSSGVASGNKRHSMTSAPSVSGSSLASTNSAQHRHSAEVTLEKSVMEVKTRAENSSPAALLDTQPTASTSQSKPSSPTPNSETSSENGQSGSSGTLSTPVYVAMYNYKPQKGDELELHRGDHYYVAEKCQDGWFKGSSVRTGQSGVFPGNYVHVFRHGSAFKPVNPNVLNIRAKAPTPVVGTDCKSGSQGDGLPAQNCATPPLMPRCSKSGNSGKKSRSPSSQLGSPLRSGPHSASTSPSRAGLSSPLNTSIHTTTIPAPPSSSNTSPHRTTWVSPHPIHQSLSASANITPPNVTLPQGLATSAPMASTAGKDKKEKKEKEKKGFVKLLVGKGKKSKAPAPETEVTPSSSDHVTHIRSGSFPSTTPAVTVHEMLTVVHRKASSMDSTLTPPIPVKPRPKPPIRERYCCIVPYPPQTDHELALELGDIIHVHRKRDDGWYKGTQERTGKTGMFPGSFVEKCD